jgi:hypothetical protein
MHRQWSQKSALGWLGVFPTREAKARAVSAGPTLKYRKIVLYLFRCGFPNGPYLMGPRDETVSPIVIFTLSWRSSRVVCSVAIHHAVHTGKRKREQASRKGDQANAREITAYQRSRHWGYGGPGER